MMTPHMYFQTTRTSKPTKKINYKLLITKNNLNPLPLSAHIANVRLDASMGPHVSGKMSGGSEPLVAHVADVWLMTSVGSGVDDERLVSAERFAADGA